MTKEQELEIIKYYTQDRLSMGQIAKLFGCSINPIARCLKRNNVQSRNSSEAARIYHLDETYFEKIDTPEKAQILGMIYADGCLMDKSKKFVWTIGLKENDKDYLEFIKHKISYSGPLYYIKKVGGNRKNQWKIGISSKKMFNDLLNIGLTPRKSLTITFPEKDKLNENLYSHFIRGYIEGDGAINISIDKKYPDYLIGYIGICGTFEFLSSLKIYLENKFNILCPIKQKKKHQLAKINTWNLRIGGNHQVIEILDWIYTGYKKDFHYLMCRKYQKYLDLKQFYVNREENKEERERLFSKKMSKILTGRPVSETTKEKIRLSNLGQKRTEETKNNIKQARAKIIQSRYKEFWTEHKDGTIYHVKGMKGFCEEFGIDRTMFSNAMNPNNSKGSKSCHGFKPYFIDPNSLPTYYIKKFY